MKVFSNPSVRRSRTLRRQGRGSMYAISKGRDAVAPWPGICDHRQGAIPPLRLTALDGKLALRARLSHGPAGGPNFGPKLAGSGRDTRGRRLARDPTTLGAE